jgi:1-acyl-sn-glycerol-3-phosphate acyltransferase
MSTSQEGVGVLYRAVRAVSRLALHLFFRHIEVEGTDDIPSDGPVLLACNHPNALVDPLLPLSILRRRVTLTAKNVLARNPLRGWLMSALGVIPFHRREDVAKGARPRQNLESMRRCREVLAGGGCLCLFPEGTSHSDDRLRPFRPGMARLLTDLVRRGGYSGRLYVVPVGLLYAEKDRFRSGVRVRFGAPIDVARWLADHPDQPAGALTAVVRRRLEGLTINYASRREALFVRRAAPLLSRRSAVTPTGRRRQPVGEWFELLACLQTGYRWLCANRPDDARALGDTLRRLNRRLQRCGIGPDDIDGAGERWGFTREVAGLVAVAPLGLFGFLAHLPAFWAVRRIARHLSRDKDHWASYALYPAVLVMPLACLVQTAAAWLSLPVAWAALYTLALPLSGYPAVVFRDRACAVGRRMGVWIRCRERNRREAGLVREVRAIRAHLLTVNAIGRSACMAREPYRPDRPAVICGLGDDRPPALSPVSSGRD